LHLVEEAVQTGDPAVLHDLLILGGEANAKEDGHSIKGVLHGLLHNVKGIVEGWLEDLVEQDLGLVGLAGEELPEEEVLAAGIVHDHAAEGTEDQFKGVFLNKKKKRKGGDEDKEDKEKRWSGYRRVVVGHVQDDLAVDICQHVGTLAELKIVLPLLGL